MINKALVDTQNSLNKFTQRVFDVCAKKGSARVQLRDGTVIAVYYFQAEHETEEDSFYSDGWEYVWNLDGSSVKSRNYDMMMIGSEKLLSTHWRNQLEN